MKIKCLMAVLAFLGITMAREANAATWNDWTEYNPATASFNEQEWRFDIAGIYGTKDRSDFSDNAGGLGVGVNYFVTRYLGAGVDTYMDDFDFPNHVDFSALARYPLENLSLAPYGFVGFGRQFRDVAQWTSHIGVGAEYRINHVTGFFVDVRYIFAGESSDLALWRFGVRFGF